MAHFAELDENNVVLRVVVISNKDTEDDQGHEVESIGVAFCENLFGGGIWKQTSYNGNIRKNFAGIGYFYDSVNDVFIPPQPWPVCILDTDTYRWNCPVFNDPNWKWDPVTKTWVYDPLVTP